jgi:hypothetical protein
MISIRPSHMSAVRTYLTDAHAIEEQAIQQLEAAAGIAGDEHVARIYREHLEETREHERLVRQRLEALGASASRVKDLAMRGAAIAMGLFARLQPDTPGKLAVQAFTMKSPRMSSCAGSPSERATLRRCR